mmetsp:Transcript_21496/g.40986  ORF Transcript_21496/g.40986 Transcript_21496/m.40986 type:complete len:230 (+) Transcript_21496:595-1284(+)
MSPSDMYESSLSACAGTSSSSWSSSFKSIWMRLVDIVEPTAPTPPVVVTDSLSVRSAVHDAPCSRLSSTVPEVAVRWVDLLAGFADLVGLSSANGGSPSLARRAFSRANLRASRSRINTRFASRSAACFFSLATRRASRISAWRRASSSSATRATSSSSANRTDSSSSACSLALRSSASLEKGTGPSDWDAAGARAPLTAAPAPPLTGGPTRPLAMSLLNMAMAVSRFT